MAKIWEVRTVHHTQLEDALNDGELNPDATMVDMLAVGNGQMLLIYMNNVSLNKKITPDDDDERGN